MSPLRAKALAALREGRVCVGFAKTELDAEASPYDVMARVRSSRPELSPYWVRLQGFTWDCTCRSPVCAHIAAVQLVTGHPSAAAKGES